MIFQDPTVKALFAVVLAEPEDGPAKLVLADKIDDFQRPWLAHAFRWCAWTGRHPSYLSGSRRWMWWPLSRLARKPELYPFCLPPTLFKIVAPGGAAVYRRAWLPFCALADAFESLHELMHPPV